MRRAFFASPSSAALGSPRRVECCSRFPQGSRALLRDRLPPGLCRSRPSRAPSHGESRSRRDVTLDSRSAVFFTMPSTSVSTPLLTVELADRARDIRAQIAHHLGDRRADSLTVGLPRTFLRRRASARRASSRRRASARRASSRGGRSADRAGARARRSSNSSPSYRPVISSIANSFTAPSRSRSRRARKALECHARAGSACEARFLGGWSSVRHRYDGEEAT